MPIKRSNNRKRNSSSMRKDLLRKKIQNKNEMKAQSSSSQSRKTNKNDILNHKDYLNYESVILFKILRNIWEPLSIQIPKEIILRIDDDSHYSFSNEERQSIFYSEIKEIVCEILGCTISHYCDFLLSKMRPGMRFDNYEDLWKIDYIIPIKDGFEGMDKKFTENEFTQRLQYKNHQPLWNEEHKLKFGKHSTRIVTFNQTGNRLFSNQFSSSSSNDIINSSNVIDNDEYELLNRESTTIHPKIEKSAITYNPYKIKKFTLHYVYESPMILYHNSIIDDLYKNDYINVNHRNKNKRNKNKNKEIDSAKSDFSCHVTEDLEKTCSEVYPIVFDYISKSHANYDFACKTMEFMKRNLESVLERKELTFSNCTINSKKSSFWEELNNKQRLNLIESFYHIKKSIEEVCVWDSIMDKNSTKSIEDDDDDDDDESDTDLDVSSILLDENQIKKVNDEKLKKRLLKLYRKTERYIRDKIEIIEKERKMIQLIRDKQIVSNLIGMECGHLTINNNEESGKHINNTKNNGKNKKTVKNKCNNCHTILDRLKSVYYNKIYDYIGTTLKSLYDPSKKSEGIDVSCSGGVINKNAKRKWMWWIDVLGCSLSDYHRYLTSMFDQNMSWANFQDSSSRLWSIEFIKPIPTEEIKIIKRTTKRSLKASSSSTDDDKSNEYTDSSTVTSQQLKKILPYFHYTNTRPVMKKTKIKRMNVGGSDVDKIYPTIKKLKMIQESVINQYIYSHDQEVRESYLKKTRESLLNNLFVLYKKMERTNLGITKQLREINKGKNKTILKNSNINILRDNEKNSAASSIAKTNRRKRKINDDDVNTTKSSMTMEFKIQKNGKLLQKGKPMKASEKYSTQNKRHKSRRGVGKNSVPIGKNGMNFLEKITRLKRAYDFSNKEEKEINVRIKEFHPIDRTGKKTKKLSFKLTFTSYNGIPFGDDDPFTMNERFVCMSLPLK